MDVADDDGVVVKQEGGEPPAVGPPTVLAGGAEVGAEMWPTMGGIHTRVNAHREKVENAISAGATRLEFELRPAAKVGATGHDVLVVYTDSYIDLSTALDFGHAAREPAAPPPTSVHGALNNFGFGLKVFQASLGEQTQVAIFTARRENGVETIKVGPRMHGALLWLRVAARVHAHPRNERSPIATPGLALHMSGRSHGLSHRQILLSGRRPQGMSCGR